LEDKRNEEVRKLEAKLNQVCETTKTTSICKIFSTEIH